MLDRAVHLHADNILPFDPNGFRPTSSPEAQHQNVVVLDAFTACTERYAARVSIPLSSAASATSYASTSRTVAAPISRPARTDAVRRTTRLLPDRRYLWVNGLPRRCRARPCAGHP